MDRDELRRRLVEWGIGPVPVRICREKAREFVRATRDDEARWTDEFAPPGIAGSVLFAVVPGLLAEAGGRAVIHGDQEFTWLGPLPVERELRVRGAVERVRERGGALFCSFRTTAESEQGGLLEGSSTFLLVEPGGRAGVEEEAEPAPDEEGPNQALPEMVSTGAGNELPPVARSVSRAGLVRYAGASGDWNPIHWDHDTAVAAGLPGVVVHGLLQSAWLCAVAARLLPGPAPLSRARFRYRAPLRPAVPAQVRGRVEEGVRLELALVSGETSHVTGSVEVAS